MSGCILRGNPVNQDTRRQGRLPAAHFALLPAARCNNSRSGGLRLQCCRQIGIGAIRAPASTQPGAGMNECENATAIYGSRTLSTPSSSRGGAVSDGCPATQHSVQHHAGRTGLSILASPLDTSYLSSTHHCQGGVQILIRAAASLSAYRTRTAWGDLLRIPDKTQGNGRRTTGCYNKGHTPHIPLTWVRPAWLFRAYPARGGLL
jgi:hypothetical protein